MQKRFTIEFAAMPDWNNTILLGELFTTETACDALNRLVSVKHPDNSVVSYRYDKGGLLQKVLHGSTQHITNITYNPKGQRENIYYGNNTKTRYYYNPLNFRLTRLLTTRNTGEVALQDLNYSYDSVGNIVSIRDNAQQTVYFSNSVIAPVSTFEYDALYRLVKATGRELSSLTAPTNTDFANTLACPNTATNAMRNYTHNYSYDELGNMQSDGWKSFIYDTATNRLLRHTGTTNVYTYDAHGNMTKMPNVSSMGWDYKDQLISAANGSTFTSYFSYDAEGNRTRKVTVKGSVREERYYINGYELYRKYTGTSLTTERKTVNISDNEKVFVRMEGEAIRYQYDNHLGSACLELDEYGYIISYEEYHPFGTTSYRAGRSATEVSWKRYKYCGKERDEETGLYYYGARYYAAWLGRFVSVDPLQHKQPGKTPFHYCSNNPINRVDPTGMQDDEPHKKHFVEYYLTPEGNVISPIGPQLENSQARLTALNKDRTVKKDTKGNTIEMAIDDMSILAELSQVKGEWPIEDAEGFAYGHSTLRFATSTDVNTMSELFMFTATYSNAEWIIYSATTDNKITYTLGTYQRDDLSPGPKDFNINANNVNAMVHSHAQKKDKNDEIGSMYGDKHIARTVQYPYYMYSASSSNLYQVTNKGQILEKGKMIKSTLINMLIKR